MLEQMIKSLPDIIKAASASELGIFALMVSALAILAYLLFGRAKPRVRLSIYMVLLAGVASYGVALTRAGSSFQTVRLTASVDAWLQAADEARKRATIASSSRLPSSLLEARARFENAWRDATWKQKAGLDWKRAYEALSLTSKLYAMQEADSLKKPSAMSWNDEVIRYCDEIQNRDCLREALLDKAGLYLDISQLSNADKDVFARVARDADEVVTRALGVSEGEQRAEVFRIASRIYYNLARPASFRLSEEWDNNYLLLSYARAVEAVNLQPRDLRNQTQLSRATMRVAKNPPQNRDREWTKKLRARKVEQLQTWNNARESLGRTEQRLPPLNVLGDLTLELVAREWADIPSLPEKKQRAAQLLEELEIDGLGPLREASALLKNSELRASYAFDLAYDIGRSYAVRTKILEDTNPQYAGAEFNEVLRNMKAAREAAKASQLDAARTAVASDITLAALDQKKKDALVKLLLQG